jgi:pimeloyl-ACP methyl ester carboxylesterase
MSTVLPIKVDKGIGFPIVLLHGLGNNFKSWTYVLDNLDMSKNTVLAIDLLGFGDAKKPNDIDYTPADHAKAVIETLERRGIQHALVAGHSMGCIVATEIAKLRPDMVKQLILLGAPLFQRLPGKYAKLKFWKKEDVYTKIFKIISQQKDLTIAAAEGVDTFIPLVKGMEITEETWLPFKRSLQNTIVQTGAYNTLCSITVPTLAVYGRLDIFVIKKNLKRVARKNKRFVTYKTMLGPHEITPIHGKSIAELLQSSSGL